MKEQAEKNIMKKKEEIDRIKKADQEAERIKNIQIKKKQEEEEFKKK